ncbi:hypothetical protein MUP77_10670 [Candidatus Bathyarchaeota archaeon]|nr:hypothetical protein [Candidatus Bathyarchaeota archaeon]
MARYLRRLTQFSLNTQVTLLVTSSTIAIIFVILFCYVEIRNQLFTVSDAVNVLLTSMIAIFASVQAISTLLQVQLENRQNKIEDEREDRRHRIENLRNELEKAYGKVYSILNKQSEPRQFKGMETPMEYVEVPTTETRQLVDTMMTFPHMFPKDIMDMWQKIFGESLTERDRDIRSSYGLPNFIPVEFKNRIIEEYNRRVKAYQELEGRNSEQSSQTVEGQGRQRMKLSRKDVWLALYGILLAFLVQVIYDGLGLLNPNDPVSKIKLGGVIAAIFLIGIIAFENFIKEKTS